MAIGNDYGYDKIFFQVVERCWHMGNKTVGFVGENEGLIHAHSDLIIAVPNTETNHIQEMHIAIGHILCGLVEDSFL